MRDFLQRTAIIWKMAVGSVLAWETARWAGSIHPYLAPLTVILCVKSAADQSVEFAYQRIGGTLFGVLFAVLAGRYLESSAWTVGLLLLVGGGLLKGLKLSDTVIREAALSILFVTALGHQRHYALDRVVDTVIGAATAIVLMLAVLPPQKGQRAQT